MRKALAVIFLAGAGWLGTVLWAGPAGAADDCAIDQRSCLAQCDKSYPARRDDMGHAGCMARCSWDGAACAGKRAVDETQAAIEREVQPWLADQAGKWQRFLDGFRRGRDEPPRSNPDVGTPL